MLVKESDVSEIFWNFRLCAMSFLNDKEKREIEAWPRGRGSMREDTMEARADKRLRAEMRLLKDSVCADISLVKRDLAPQIRPEEKIDNTVVSVLCEGGVCEVVWHPVRKAA